MKWKGRARSENVEDRRSGGGGRVSGGAKKFGIGTVIIVIIALLFGENPLQFINLADQFGTTTTNQAPTGSASISDADGEFVSVVLKETEDVWNQIIGSDYKEPVLVLFSGEVESRCGFASAATGPFYCPGDQKLYIDLSFYRDLKTKFGAPGDFAMAYVVAHEIGHHIQYLMGITKQVDSQRGKISQADYNELSVKLELQADFLAGVWAHHVDKYKGILEPGDIEEALNAANAIGDDRLQKQSRGYVVPESFTHGTSAQRVRWFKKGYETGDLSQGDTFNTQSL
jgi:predicted metalloprotease